MSQLFLQDEEEWHIATIKEEMKIEETMNEHKAFVGW